MKKLRFLLAVWAAKIVAFCCRIARYRASALPGKYALKFDPDFLSKAATQLPGKLIVVCGTNGKTTTNNLIASALEASGLRTVCNRAGANMLNGVAAAFAQKISLFGKQKADCASIEADEATLPLLFDHLVPDILCVTNLFRDQLDRYGEIDIASELLKKAFAKAPNAAYILNADDPVTSVFGEGRQAVYYGIAKNPDMLCCEEIRDGSNCQVCGTPLAYDYYNYGQLGRYQCESCGYCNPAITYGADNIRIVDGTLDFDICTAGDADGASLSTVTHIHTGVAGLYNVYNMLTAFAACSLAGVPPALTAEIFNAQRPEPGRMSRFQIGGNCVYLILSKNPTGFNQSVTTVLNDRREKDMMLVLNDNPQDGEDVSWIWDVDFETMKKAQAGHYTITGQRRYDMYLRLKYAGYDEAALSVSPSIQAALEEMLRSDKSLYYVLVNYTAMYPAYVALGELEQKSKAKEGQNE